MKKMLIAGGLLLSVAAAAQDEDVLRAALYLTGASAAEEADAAMVELLESRRGRPVRVNDPRLRPSEVLSDYQVAVIRDYRSLSGDILSWEELALLDGFGAEAVAALRPFLSLATSRAPDTLCVSGQALVRATLTGVGGKARVQGSWWRAGGALRGRDGTFYGEVSGRRTRWILGDYKLRFGQGAALWTGFSMDNLSTVDAFIKRGQGCSPVWSYSRTSALRGLVGEADLGPVRATAFGALGGTYGVRAEYLGRSAQAGVTVASQPNAPLILSADGRWEYKGVLLVAEAAWKNRAFSGVVATRVPLGDQLRLALQGRVIPCAFSGRKYGEYALAAGVDAQSGHWRGLDGRTGFGSSVPRWTASLTADAALLPIPLADPGRLQVRVYARAAWQFSGRWALEARVTERYRNYERPRTALQANLHYGLGSWQGTLRWEGVLCQRLGTLLYTEAGYKAPVWTAWLRVSGFWIDSWNDRIYCYERDAPGTFSVPAYYGRGAAVSAVGSWKHRFGRVCTLAVYLRAAWMVRQGRQPAPTLNLQLQCTR